jgi:hypothetical protein
MSHKNKKHQQRLQNREENVQQSTEQGTRSTLSSLGEQARSTLNSVGETARNHQGLLLGIAGAGISIAGAAAYLITTERGQAIQERISETVKDSACKVQDAALAGWTRVRDFVVEFGEESEEQSAMEEEDSFEAMPDRFRRVV